MDIEVESYCQLLSADNLHPPIELEDGKPTVIGRGPLTKITSKKCSRKQVELVANYQSEEVTLRHLGANPSKVGSQYLKQGDEYILGAGGIFQLVEEYSYRIFFGKRVTEEGLKLLKDESLPSEEKPDCHLHNDPLSEQEISAECSTKRMKLDGKCMQSHSTAMPPLVREKMKTIDSFFQVTPTTCETLDSEWFDFGSLILLRYGHPSPSARIASFDLDNTLIETASGKRFATGPHDWKIMSHVPEKLKSMYDDGFKIVIFTNQAGIQKGKITRPELKQKLEKIAKKLAMPLTVLISTNRDVFRKPCTGMWEHMVQNENDGIEPDLSCNIYVGDAAGRLAGWKPGAKKDFSDSDRKFASNLGVTFATPEKFFLGYTKCSKFSLGEFDPRLVDITKKNHQYDPPDAAPTSLQPEMVIFVGFPASGKSTFYEKVMKPKGYCHVSRDKLGSWQKCVAMCDQVLQNGKSVVIDNTNPDIESRSRYINCAKKHSIPVRCFQFTTSLQQAKHNNKFRDLTSNDSTSAKVTDIAFNVYKSKFVQPDLKEGFGEIINVTICPNFSDEKLGALYKQFLI